MYYEKLKRFLDKHPDPTSKFKLCAVVLKGSRVQTYGFNRAKTDPIMKNLAEAHNIQDMYDHSCHNYVSCNIHAETNALKRLGRGSADTLVVMRRNMDGEFTIARPCKVCLQAIREANIQKVFFTNKKGEFELLDLRG